MRRATLLLLSTVCAGLCVPSICAQKAQKAEKAQKVQDFKDDPAAHALYDAMIAAMRNAKTLSYVSTYRWEARGKVIGRCTYRVRMKKPNYFHVETTRSNGDKAGVIVGDGDTMWIHWPQGRPFFSTEDPKTYRNPRTNQYMRVRTPVGQHSIGHQTGLLGAGMSMPILDPSTFHGYTDSLQPYLDGVRSEGTEEVGDEPCDIILVSIMKGQRTWKLWLSQRDHLPRKLRQDLYLKHNQSVDELWTEVKVDADMPKDLFVWEPPDGWKPWYKPNVADRLLKPGSKAPDFTLTLADGKEASLSDYLGKVVWLNIWRVG